MHPLPHPPVLTSDTTILLDQSQETLIEIHRVHSEFTIQLTHLSVYACGGLCNGAPCAATTTIDILSGTPSYKNPHVGPL